MDKENDSAFGPSESLDKYSFLFWCCTSPFCNFEKISASLFCRWILDRASSFLILIPSAFLQSQHILKISRKTRKVLLDGNKNSWEGHRSGIQTWLKWLVMGATREILCLHSNTANSGIMADPKHITLYLLVFLQSSATSFGELVSLQPQIQEWFSTHLTPPPQLLTCCAFGDAFRLTMVAVSGYSSSSKSVNRLYSINQNGQSK